MTAENVVIEGSWEKKNESGGGGGGETPDPTPVQYTVSYRYVGEVPENAPEVPASAEYAEGAAVSVADAPTLEGYEFSGWNRTDFTQPAENVVIEGSSEKNHEGVGSGVCETPDTAPIHYSVTYRYVGKKTNNAPEVPASAEYAEVASVTVADAPTLAA